MTMVGALTVGVPNGRGPRFLEPAEAPIATPLHAQGPQQRRGNVWTPPQSSWSVN